jgi:hypothetical protein
VNDLVTVLYDFAGFDGMALARDFFGPWASELAVYQSQDTEWSGVPCALLRVCENNFRVSVHGVAAGLEEALTEAATGCRVWVKPAGLASLFLREGPEWEQLAKTATTKAPHRLTGLAMNHAVPARIVDCAALIWRHGVNDSPAIEIQTALADQEAIKQSLYERS